MSMLVKKSIWSLVLAATVCPLAHAAGTFSGGRGGRYEGGGAVADLPALTCSLRNLQRAAFVVKTSASDRQGRSTAYIYTTGPDDVLVNSGKFFAQWTPGGNDFSLHTNDYLLRVFGSTDDPAGRLYATFEYAGSDQLILLWCSKAK